MSRSDQMAIINNTKKAAKCLNKRLVDIPPNNAITPRNKVYMTPNTINANIR